MVYLTFDDGPSYNTSRVLDILQAYDVKATFFVCGNARDYGVSIYKRIVEEGHSIGNHTYSHNYSKIYTSEKAFMEDFKKLEEHLYASTGVRTEIMRFPGGSNNTVSLKYGDRAIMERIINKIVLEGYQYFDWNVSSRDAEVSVQDEAVIIHSVLKGIEGRDYSIVLMHDSPAKITTVEALPIIIRELKERGYAFQVLTKNSPYIHYR